MSWYVVYRGKPQKDLLTHNLDEAGVTYFVPIQVTERLVGDRMEEFKEILISNIIFIKTENSIYNVITAVDGLRYPLIDVLTKRPAIVSDREMDQFQKVLQVRSAHAQFLADPFSKFANHPKVRVKAGMFEGLEGHVVRIRKNRQIVISLSDIAIAVSGIHYTLLEIIE